jgi:hypothetical protein
VNWKRIRYVGFSDIPLNMVVKGFALDDERLKNLDGGSYWKESLKKTRRREKSEFPIFLLSRLQLSPQINNVKTTGECLFYNKIIIIFA